MGVVGSLSERRSNAPGTVGGDGVVEGLPYRPRWVRLLSIVTSVLRTVV